MQAPYMGGLQPKNVDNMGKSVKNVPVRFFKWDDDALSCACDHRSGDFVECTESEFIDAPGSIEYKRYTVFENGVSQIVLTKNPFKG